MLTVLVLLPACGVDGSDTSRPFTSRRASATTAAPTVSAAASTTAVTASPTTQGPRTEKWIDLAVGDCLADPPPSDPSVVTVPIVDCAAAHGAEVYSRVPVAVNAAIADVANRECAAEFTRYTGRSVNDSPFTVTYLIDSNQDRTSDNPAPSTVICLLQAANGQPLTGSARR
ncbi:MAG: hypothetical protein ACRDTN_19185 [Mycobacterium sp.]